MTHNFDWLEIQIFVITIKKSCFVYILAATKHPPVVVFRQNAWVATGDEDNRIVTKQQ